MKSGSPNDQKVEPNDGQICGQGLGACCAGSNDGCPPEAPICSEYGYCQCTSYKPGDPECGPGFGDSASNNRGEETQGNGGQICGEGQGACCAGSNDGCPPEAPVCSEWGYCQCAEYQPGDPECGPGFDDVPENSQATENDGLGFGGSAPNKKGGDTQGNGGKNCGEG